ncbi:MAG: hypothetical protein R3C01_07300 [Planctomycetaceae bacterium]
MMPSVYRISKAAGFQSLEPVDEEEYQRKREEGAWAFTGRRYRGEWTPIELRRSGEGASPDIWTFRNTILIEENAIQPLGLYIEQTGNFYAVPFEGRELLAVHVMYAPSCLDVANSTFDDSTNPPSIKEYALHRSRIDWSLFKIPETHETEILTVQGLVADDSEFKSQCEKHRFTGIVFDLLDEW